MRSLILFGFVLLIGMFGQSDEARAACVEKKVTDGHLIALIPDSELTDYAALGFSNADCPENYTAGPELAEGWCASFAGFDAASRQSFADKFGVTTVQVCASARAYYASN